MTAAAFPACALDAEGQRSRADEFRALLAPAVRAVRRSGATAEIDLALDAGGRQRLEGLLERERECCTFWRFSLAPRPGGGLLLEVRAEPPHEPALEAFLSLAHLRQARAGSHRRVRVGANPPARADGDTG
jgi:hypothetical protein